jgi:hypothetical protein
MTRQDAADLLGITQDASSSEVRQAFRQQAQRFHPDSGGQSSQFVLLQRAKDLLLRNAETHGAIHKAPAFKPLISYPVRLSIAAAHDKNLRPKALRTWVYLAVGLPLAYFVGRDMLALLLLPLMAAFLVWAVIRSH